MEEVNKTVYRVDSQGKVRVLIITTNDGVLSQSSGILYGNLTTRESTSKPKNVGKSNETTAREQAILEANSKIKKKLEEGYFNTVAEAKNTRVILPMLAKSYKNEKHKIDWDNAYVQPKLDGMRCLDLPSGKISRKNKEITTLDHIEVARPKNLDIILDGELYVHGESFQTNMKYIKKYRKGKTERINYWVYDIVSDKPFIDRILDATVTVAHSKNCVIVPTYKVENETQVSDYHKKFISEGYEGTMIRWGDEKYILNKRSSNLLKHKDFIDESYEVVDVEPSDKDPRQGVIICKVTANDGSEQRFGCGMKFSHKVREDILINKDEYIGQKAEVRFFEFTDSGIPRFPVCVGFRLDK